MAYTITYAGDDHDALAALLQKLPAGIIVRVSQIDGDGPLVTTLEGELGNNNPGTGGRELHPTDDDGERLTNAETIDLDPNKITDLYVF